MRETRLIIKCAKHQDHQKILRFDEDLNLTFVEILARILDGTSKHYIHKPQEGSPIGKCAICGEPIACKIESKLIGKRRPQEYANAES